MRICAAGALASLFLFSACILTPPAVPDFVSSADSVYLRASAAFELTSSAPGNRDLVFILDWDDGPFDTTADFPSAETVAVRHTWQSAGEHRVRARAALAGEPGRASGWSDPLTVRVLANGIPSVPRVFLPERVVPGGIALFRATTTDPDEDSVAFLFDFGSTVGGWTGLMSSGSTALDSHRYAAPGTYRIRCRAKDGKGSQSDWSEPELLSVDTAGGVLWWWRPDGGYVEVSPVLALAGAEELVYVAGTDGRAYALTVQGDVRYSAACGVPTGHPAFSPSTGHLLVGTAPGVLRALTLSLAPVWNVEDSPATFGTPAVNGSAVYVSSSRDTLYVFADLGMSARHDGAYAFGNVSSAPVIDAAGFVYVGADSGKLYKMEPGLAAPVWVKTLGTGDDIIGLAIGADGTIYCGTRGGRMHAVVPSDGAVRWTATLDGDASPAAVSETAVFVGTPSGRMYCLDAATGVEKWTRQLGTAGLRAGPVLAGDYIYCQDDDDVLYCLRQSDGESVWSCRCRDYGPPQRTRRESLTPFAAPGPTILSDGNIVVVGAGALYCVAGDKSRPLAAAPWPKWQRDSHNTGKAGR